MVDLTKSGGDSLKVAMFHLQIHEHPVDLGRGLVEDVFAKGEYAGENDAVVMEIRLTSDQPITFQSSNSTGHRGGVYLEAVADLAHGELTFAGESEQPEYLEPGES